MIARGARDRARDPAPAPIGSSGLVLLADAPPRGVAVWDVMRELAAACGLGTDRAGPIVEHAPRIVVVHGARDHRGSRVAAGTARSRALGA